MVVETVGQVMLGAAGEREGVACISLAILTYLDSKTGKTKMF